MKLEKNEFGRPTFLNEPKEYALDVSIKFIDFIRILFLLLEYALLFASLEQNSVVWN